MADLRTLITGSTQTFLAGTTGTRYWFIDEISSVSGDWPNTIKNLRDNAPDFAADTVVLTGSSAARLHEVRKALAGRRGSVTNSDRTLLPMRFTDVVAASGLSLPTVPAIPPRDLADTDLRERVSPLLPYLNDLVALWEVYLRVGGFPQAVTGWRTTGDVGPGFIDTMWDVVYGDAITGARFSAPQTAALLSRLTVNLRSPLNVADLARDVDVSHATAKERLTNLAESFLTWPCHREQGLMPKLNAQTKWYFADPVLARLATVRGHGREPDLTQLSEQQLGLALLRKASCPPARSDGLSHVASGARGRRPCRDLSRRRCLRRIQEADGVGDGGGEVVAEAGSSARTSGFIRSATSGYGTLTVCTPHAVE